MRKIWLLSLFVVSTMITTATAQAKKTTTPMPMETSPKCIVSWTSTVGCIYNWTSTAVCKIKTTTPIECKDKLTEAQCKTKIAAMAAYCSTNGAKMDCMKTCKRCPGGGGVTLAPGECKDIYSNCKANMAFDKNLCKTHKDNCKKTCGLCAAVCKDTSEICKDNRFQPGKIACSTNNGVKYCKKKCGTCGLNQATTKKPAGCVDQAICKGLGSLLCGTGGASQCPKTCKLCKSSKA